MPPVAAASGWTSAAPPASRRAGAACAQDMWMRGCRLSAMGKTVSVGDETLVEEGWMWKRGGSHAKFKKRCVLAQSLRLGAPAHACRRELRRARAEPHDGGA